MFESVLIIQSCFYGCHLYRPNDYVPTCNILGGIFGMYSGTLGDWLKSDTASKRRINHWSKASDPVPIYMNGLSLN